MIKNIKLSEWARRHSYTYRGAWGLYKLGGIPGAHQLPTGTVLIESDDEVKALPEHNVVYARVSSSENRKTLDSQAARVAAFCAAKGWVVHSVVKECASGLNDKRPKLGKVMVERKATRLVVEHKDRLTRFGFNFISVLWPECSVVVINEVAEDKEDLLQDFVALVTSFCARIYGFRRSRRKTEQLIEQLRHDTISQSNTQVR